MNRFVFVLSLMLLWGFNFIVATSLSAQQVTHVHDIVEIVKKVGPHGQGHAEAAAAMEKLNKLPPIHFPHLIVELNDANPIAANWIRGVIDRMVEQTIKENALNAEPKPGQSEASRAKMQAFHARLLKESLDSIERMVLNTSNADRTRRTAFEILTKFDQTTPDRLLPKMLDDPSLELRRDSIAKLLSEVEKESKEKQLAGYNVAFEAARDPDQVRSIAKKLRTMGEKVDLPKKFGLVMDWNVIGPFDNTGRKGFDQIFPPEERIDLAGVYDGKLDKTKVKWQETQSVKENGIVDLNKPLGELKEVTGYAYTEFESESDMTCQLRVACSVAVKVWVNDNAVLARNIYASNPDIDQYVMNVKLKAGKNKILVKVLQNEVTEVWAKTWEFSLRVCDDKGGAILAKNRKSTPEAAIQSGAEKKAATF